MNRAFSFGGGRQSTAALVLAARGELEVDCFVFANVGDDSENPDTLAYVEEHAKPFARRHGLDLVEVQRKFRDGRNPSLLAHIQHDQRGVAIPMRMADTGAPGNRKCTSDWKIRVVANYLHRERGWRSGWDLAIGISWDESYRIRGDEMTVGGLTWTRSYPLCDLRLRVDDCAQLVADAGLPPAPKSSCWFCPYHSRADWSRMRLHKPELFERAVKLEQQLNTVRQGLGRDRVYFTDRLRPLDVSIPQGVEQLDLFEGEDAACSSGYCWT